MPTPPSGSNTPPHHRPDGGFRNPWPDAEVQGFKALIRWRLLDRPREKIAPTPPYDSFPRATPSFFRPRAKPGQRSVTCVGHASFLLQFGPLNVLTDPVWSERASPIQWVGPKRMMSPGIAFDALPEIDIVLLSHNHYDHLDATTVRRIAERFPNASWLCPLRLGPLLRSFGVRHFVERDWWQIVETPNFKATATPAQHFSARGVGDRGDTLWCGWTIESDGVCVYFAGDTALHPEFDQIGARLGPFDLMLLPIGAYEPRWFMRSVHMNPEDALEAYRAIVNSSSKTPPCVPIHWGVFRLTDEPMDEPPKRWTDGWKKAGYDPAANWVMAIGETKTF
ncbi:MAG TPA: MBL fold metallo-hydrolase [Gemmatimonadaceae bacterium]|jgi:L-ascorbate metabolism protein UlaG (beta-lactamase superfamily)